MNPAELSKCVALSTGVLPTIVALVVAATMIIERLQVDWTASCALVANVPQPCGQSVAALHRILQPAQQRWRLPALSHQFECVGYNLLVIERKID
jgi:hypothetical protein